MGVDALDLRGSGTWGDHSCVETVKALMALKVSGAAVGRIEISGSAVGGGSTRPCRRKILTEIVE